VSYYAVRVLQCVYFSAYCSNVLGAILYEPFLLLSVACCMNVSREQWIYRYTSWALPSGPVFWAGRPNESKRQKVVSVGRGLKGKEHAASTVQRVPQQSQAETQRHLFSQSKYWYVIKTKKQQKV
jgi:hypothetical protein